MWRKVVARLVDVRENEAAPMLLASLMFFCLFFGYFLIRPLRETMGLRGGRDEVRVLFQVTAVAVLLVNLFYGPIASRLSRRVLVPGVYASVIASMLGFLAWMYLAGAGESAWLYRVFYVWLSVINLFMVSVFWQLLSDVFTLEQGKRLFGFIGVGGTAGAIAGSSFAWTFAGKIESAGSMLGHALGMDGRHAPGFLFESLMPFVLVGCAGALIGIAGVIAVVLSHTTPLAGRLDHSEKDLNTENSVIGGRAWSGLTRLFRDRYLGGIGLLVLLFAVGSTLLYFEKLRIVELVAEDDGERTELFARIELAGQILTVVLQVLLTGRLMKLVGVGTMLAVVPLVTVVGFTVLGFDPSLLALTIFEAGRRASNFALTKPARETLFTVVEREDKYKAKAAIDTFVYRGGDSVGNGIDWMLAKLALPLTVIAIPVGLAGVLLARWLGAQEKARSESG